MNRTLDEIQANLSLIASEDIEKSFIGVYSGNEDDEVVIKANKEGLISFANAILKLATGITGSHVNFDSNSNANDANAAIIVVHANAPWDTEN